MYTSTKILELGSCAFRQWRAAENREAGDNSERCSKVHGYKLTAKFWFSCSELDDRNWCVDFGGLGKVKALLKRQFDHTLCIAKDDPLLHLFKDLHEKGGCDLRIMDAVGIERTAEWCIKNVNPIIKEITNNRCWCERVEVWEHEGNSAIATLQTSTTFKGKPKKLPEPVITETVTPNPTPVATVPIPAVPPPAAPANCMPLHNVKTTNGYKDLFKGTSWGGNLKNK
jgi:6-pyruvoyltetrahydropterin/6-carboxytetrahydropterin synthase